METLPESRPSTISLAGKRVLFGITKSNWGGAQAYVTMLARASRDAGADVAVMAGGTDGHGSDSGKLFEVLSTEQIRTVPLSSIGRDIHVSSDWQALRELIAVVKKEKPDILHLNSSKMGLLGALAGRIVGVKRIVFTAHGWPHKEERSPLWKIMAWGGSWATIVLSSRIIAVSDQDLRDSPTLLFRDKLRLIHNGISDFPRLSREDARAALEKYSHDLSKFPQLLFMNAELHMSKGIGTAIRALAELAHHHSGLALVVCGEGDARSYLTELALSLHVSPRVFLLGFVPDARELLAAGDIYLMPSGKEGLPLALLEAGLAALPVVGSKVGGIPDVITDHQTGLFMPRGNTHILAKAIAFYLDNPHKAAEYGAALREKVLTDFSEGQMVEFTLKEYV